MRIEDRLTLESQRNESLRDWTIVALVVVVIAAVVFGRADIEHALLENAQAAIVGQGLATTELELAFHGRTAVVAGQVPDPQWRERLIATLGRVEGVRKVKAELSVAPLAGLDPTPMDATSVAMRRFLSWDGTEEQPTIVAQWRPPMAPGPERPGPGPGRAPAPQGVVDPTDPVVIAQIEAGKLVLLGNLADDEAMRRLVDAAIETYGADRVTNRMQTNPEVRPADWLHKVPTFLAKAQEIDQVVLVFSDVGIGVSDITAEDQARLRAARDQTRSALPEGREAVPAASGVEVAQPPAALAGTERISVRVQQDVVEVAGTVHSATKAERFRSALAAAFDRPVNDGITVDPSVVPADWLTQLNATWPILSQIQGLRVDATGQEVVIGGTIPREADRPVVVDAVRTLIAPATIEDRIQVIDWQARGRSIAERFTDQLGYGLAFLDGRPELTPGSEERLSSLVEALEANPGVRLGIGVHTDSRGTPESNRELTQGRADEIRNRLIQRGIAPDRLEAVGFGESRPVADNSTREGRAQNRRVEFFALPGA
jgi:outer membrane protein OmpA-like peptidoglycan-associated protein